MAGSTCAQVQYAIRMLRHMLPLTSAKPDRSAVDIVWHAQLLSHNMQDGIRPHSITLSNGCADYKHKLRLGKRTNGSYRCPMLSFEKR